MVVNVLHAPKNNISKLCQVHVNNVNLIKLLIKKKISVNVLLVVIGMDKYVYNVFIHSIMIHKVENALFVLWIMCMIFGRKNVSHVLKINQLLKIIVVQLVQLIISLTK